MRNKRTGFGRDVGQVKHKALLRRRVDEGYHSLAIHIVLGGTWSMGTSSDVHVGEVTPDGAWRILVENSTAKLIDVRTRAEWGFVGVPDLEEAGQRPLFIEWSSFPEMSPNPRFAEEVMEALGATPQGPLLFLCRSGARSLKAAEAVAAHLARAGNVVDCINVAEGFEGDLDPTGHRGSLNGWKARGLAWRQS